MAEEETEPQTQLDGSPAVASASKPQVSPEEPWARLIPLGNAGLVGVIVITDRMVTFGNANKNPDAQIRFDHPRIRCARAPPHLRGCPGPLALATVAARLAALLAQRPCLARLCTVAAHAPPPAGAAAGCACGVPRAAGWVAVPCARPPAPSPPCAV